MISALDANAAWLIGRIATSVAAMGGLKVTIGSFLRTNNVQPVTEREDGHIVLVAATGQ